MSENLNVPEQYQDKEPTIDDIINVCIEQLGEEVLDDFFKELDLGDFGEVLGYAYTLLLENGIDPDEIFIEKGIIE